VDLATIYVALLDEGVDVWRPVLAERISLDCFRITGVNADPEDEHWEFQTGDVVRCEFRQLSEGKRLVAVEVARPAASAE
jgi:hypothetical protein